MSFDRQNKNIQKKIAKLQKRVKKRTLDRSVSQFRLALRRFRRNKAGIAGLIVVIIMFIIAILATPLTLSVGVRNESYDIKWDGLLVYKPDTSFDIWVVESEENQSSIYQPAYQPPGVYSGYHLRKGENVTLNHILGTNIGGQDIFSRMLLGTRLTLLVALGATIISLIIGIPLGMVAGYFGGKVDELIMRITDMFLTFPFYLIVLLVVTIIMSNQDIENLLTRLQISADVIIAAEILGFGLFGWMAIARLIRAEIFQVKAMDYVEAARALGAGPQRILVRHILPNVLSSLIIIVTYNMALYIISEAAVAFLLLSDSNIPSWGQEITAGLDFLIQAWWPVIFPGIAITIAVIAFNLLGDSLRDSFDPRLR
ncbi:MAG: ABC transporter permease [Candidatus Hodarchaeales archaeon]|jgi:peptide/nickel transport system permease protein